MGNSCQIILCRVKDDIHSITPQNSPGYGDSKKTGGWTDSDPLKWGGLDKEKDNLPALKHPKSPDETNLSQKAHMPGYVVTPSPSSSPEVVRPQYVESPAAEGGDDKDAVTPLNKTIGEGTSLPGLWQGDGPLISPSRSPGMGLTPAALVGARLPPTRPQLGPLGALRPLAGIPAPPLGLGGRRIPSLLSLPGGINRGLKPIGGAHGLAEAPVEGGVEESDWEEIKPIKLSKPNGVALAPLMMIAEEEVDEVEELLVDENDEGSDEEVEVGEESQAWEEVPSPVTSEKSVTETTKVAKNEEDGMDTSPSLTITRTAVTPLPAVTEEGATEGSMKSTAGCSEIEGVGKEMDDSQEDKETKHKNDQEKELADSLACKEEQNAEETAESRPMDKNGQEVKEAENKTEKEVEKVADAEEEEEGEVIQPPVKTSLLESLGPLPSLSGRGGSSGAKAPQPQGYGDSPRLTGSFNRDAAVRRAEKSLLGELPTVGVVVGAGLGDADETAKMRAREREERKARREKEKEEKKKAKRKEKKEAREGKEGSPVKISSEKPQAYVEESASIPALKGHKAEKEVRVTKRPPHDGPQKENKDSNSNESDLEVQELDKVTPVKTDKAKAVKNRVTFGCVELHEMACYVLSDDVCSDGGPAYHLGNEEINSERVKLEKFEKRRSFKRIPIEEYGMKGRVDASTRRSSLFM